MKKKDPYEWFSVHRHFHWVLESDFLHKGQAQKLDVQIIIELGLVLPNIRTEYIRHPLLCETVN